MTEYKSWYWRLEGNPTDAGAVWDAVHLEYDAISALVDNVHECHQTRADWLAEVNDDIDVELDRERLLSYIQD